MAREKSITIYANPQKIPAKYRKYKLKDCSVPILRRKLPKKFEMGFWDDHKKIEKYLSRKEIPDFTMRDVANMCTNYKCLETVKWITKFVYQSHKTYFENDIVSLCDLTKQRINKLARKFSKHVQPEIRKHFIMACIAKDFDVYVHANYDNFHENMLVSYIASHLRFKFDDRQEFIFAATQYVCQRIMERGARQQRCVLFTPYRIGCEGWHNQTKDEPLNYFVFEGKNNFNYGIYPRKEDFEEAITDFNMFKAGIFIKIRSHENQKAKQGSWILPNKRNFESQKDSLSYELQPRKRGRPKKSEANKQRSLCENKILVKRGKNRNQEQNQDKLTKQRLETKHEELSKRGQRAKRRKLEINEENFSDQQHKDERPRKRMRLTVDKEKNLLKPNKDKPRNERFLQITDIEDLETSDEDTVDKRVSPESSNKQLSTGASNKPWTLLDIFKADMTFRTAAEAMRFYYTGDSEPQPEKCSLLCHQTRKHCSPFISVIHC